MEKIQELFANTCYAGWITALIMALTFIVTLVIHIKGDKITRSNIKQKRNEFRNISFAFLVQVLKARKILNEDGIPILDCQFIDKLVSVYNQEFAKYEPIMTCCEKIRYKKYIQTVLSYNKDWRKNLYHPSWPESLRYPNTNQNPAVINQTNKIDKLLRHEQKKLLKHITWLGKKTGRVYEVNQLKNTYE